MEQIESTSVQEQLEKICGSKEFTGKKLLCSMLTYLVTEHLAGRSEFIKGYTIAVDVFGRDEDFDPDRNTLVRIHAGRLRRQLKLYYLDAGKNDPILIKIPKGRYIPVISTDRSEKSVVAKEGNGKPKKRRPKIAVLPLDNLSENSNFDYLTTSFSLELSEELTKYEDFSVVGINMTRDRLQAEDHFFDKVEKKGISYLVKGSIQDVGERVVIRYHLIDITENTQLWADKVEFDSKEDRLYDTFQKLANKVASYIGAEYGYINLDRYRKLMSDKPNSLLEQDLILKYYHSFNSLDKKVMEDFHRSVFEALELEPNSAIINTLAGDILGGIYSIDLPGADEAYKSFGHFIEKGFSLDPNHPRITCSLMFKCFVFDEKERFMHLLEKYKDIMPKSPLKLGALAINACLFGEWEIGMELMDEVYENNLNVPGYFYGMRSCYYYKQKEYQHALAEAQQYHMPGVYWAPFYRTIALAQLGKIAEAKKEVKDLLTVRPDFATRGHHLLSIMVKDNLLREHMIEGLEKAGLTLAQ